MSDSVVRARASALVPYIIQNLGDFAAMTPQQLNTAITEAISAYVTVNTPGLDIPLSGVALNYEDNKAEIQAILTANPVWKDTITAATGQIIIEMIATALTYMQYNIVRCTEETMIDTARISSSIFAITRLLGVRIARRIPSNCMVNLFRTGDLTSSLTIAPYQQFTAASTSGNNVNLFNRYAIIFPANTNVITTTLYEGQANNTATFISSGLPYQTFIIGSDDFAVSDVDVVCSVNGVYWARAEYADYFSLGLWEYSPTSLVFTDDSTADGNVEIKFGNGTFGKIPPVNNQISLNYVLTSGADGNVNLVGGNLNASFSNLITGTVTSTNQNGNDALSAEDYQSLSPGLYSAKLRASTGGDNNAIARRYPGVIDAIVEGQRDVAPNDLRQMLIARCTLITNTVWQTSDFAAFAAWFENLSIANIRIYNNPSTPIIMNVAANVFCKGNAPLDGLQNQIISNLQNAFLTRAGVLGYERTVSDVIDIIKTTNRALIDYVDIIAPTGDQSVTNDQYVVLGSTVSINMAYTTRVGF